MGCGWNLRLWAASTTFLDADFDVSYRTFATETPYPISPMAWPE